MNFRKIFNVIFDKMDHNNKNKVKKRSTGKLILNDEMQNWIDENYEMFLNNYTCYENNCCVKCGVILNSEIKNSKVCPSCKSKLICRTNKETGKKLILTSEQLDSFDKSDKIRKDILFYEKWLKSLNNMYPDYMYYFWRLKKEKPGMSARDYTWSFENWLFNKLDTETVRAYQKHMKLSFGDMVLECDWDVFRLKHISNVYRFMIEIAKYNEKYDVMEEMMLSLIYRSVTLAQLNYYHYPDRPFSESLFFSDASFGMFLVRDYLEIFGLKFEDLKDSFMKKAHPFIINTISKEEAWPLLCQAYKKYNSLLNEYK